MKRIVGFSLLIGLALAACGPSSGSNSGSKGKQGPPDMLAEALHAKPLTADQKIRIGKALKNDARLSPMSSLYFATHAHLSDREFSKLDVEGKAVLEQVKTKCTIVQFAPESSKVPDKRTRSVSGAGCPVSYSETETTTSRPVRDEKTGKMKGTCNQSKVSSRKILDPALRGKLWMVEEEDNMTSTATFNDVEVGSDGKVLSGSVTSSGETTIKAARTDGMRITGSLKAVAEVAPGKKNMTVLLKFRTAEGDDIVLAGSISNDRADYILNGESYTAQALNEMGFSVDHEIP